ncbi:DUF1934 domain-containing protein [Sporofaciens sp. SGI.106]|uniref:DUF1934 domain-containing protein n=1 Tax=Sporofaciens sp. SGI.106 TaxID=3420568 RepID=UPI002A9EFC57|nr:DUF1934 domain-containing protein [Lachnoclostridium sp.]
MTKDVLISISGLHYSVDEENGAEPLEVITPASYYFKNGKHYVLYDEVVEGIPGTIKNTIKITGDRLFEINKSGIASTRMVFEKDRINMTNYQTPFGDMMVGIHTKDMRVDVQEENIDVHINYALDVNNEPLSECEIKVNIRGL